MKQKLAINVFIAFILGMIASEVVTTILYNRTLIEFGHHDDQLSRQQSIRLHTQISNQQKKRQKQRRQQEEKDKKYNQLHHRAKIGAVQRSKMNKSNPSLSISNPSIFKSDKKNINLPQKNKGVQNRDPRLSFANKNQVLQYLKINGQQLDTYKKNHPKTYINDLYYISLQNKRKDLINRLHELNHPIDHNAMIQNMKSMPRSYMR